MFSEEEKLRKQLRKNRDKVCLVLGHKEGKEGAINRFEGITEWMYNGFLSNRVYEMYSNLVILYKELLIPLDDIFELIQVERDTYLGLPEKINKLKPTCIISLHCNAFNTTISGTEVLCASGSSKAKHLSGLLQRNIVGVLGLPNRGVKELDEEDRGGYLLYGTKAPCAIIEPFFIDNPEDFRVGMENVNKIAEEIIYSILEYLDYRKSDVVFEAGSLG
jgi:N-acetylmuramoyl-L-alanine amidase